jgi:PTS system mannose-specific IID component
VTPLLLSLGISLALEGRLVGPLLYAGLISAIVIPASRLFWVLGHRWGRAAVSQILASGWVQALTEGAALVGMMVAGALLSSIVNVSTPVSFTVGQATVSLQSDVLDAVMRNLLPLLLSVGAWWLLERRVPTMRLIGTVFVVGILGTYVGLLGSWAPPLFGREWLEFLAGGSAVTLRSLLLHLWPALLTLLAAGVWYVLSRRRGD